MLYFLSVINFSYSGTIFVVDVFKISSKCSSVREARCLFVFMSIMEQVCSHVYVLPNTQQTCRAESLKFLNLGHTQATVELWKAAFPMFISVN
jgi:hypothetical protein